MRHNTHRIPSRICGNSRLLGKGSTALLHSSTMLVGFVRYTLRDIARVVNQYLTLSPPNTPREQSGGGGTTKSDNSPGVLRRGVLFYHSISLSPFFRKNSFTCEKCLHPKNPRYAESGDGCAAVSTRCLLVSIAFPFSCA